MNLTPEAVEAIEGGFVRWLRAASGIKDAARIRGAGFAAVRTGKALKGLLERYFK